MAGAQRGQRPPDVPWKSDRLRRAPAARARRAQVLGDGQVAVQAELLRHIADAFLHFLLEIAFHVAGVLHDDPAPVRADDLEALAKPAEPSLRAEVEGSHGAARELDDRRDGGPVSRSHVLPRRNHPPHVPAESPHDVDPVGVPLQEEIQQRLVGSAVHLALDHRDRPERGLADQVHGPQVRLGVPLLVLHHHDPPELPGGILHPAGLLDRHGDGLLNQHVHAALQAVDRDRRVQARVQADDHPVESLGLQHPPVVGVGPLETVVAGGRRGLRLDEVAHRDPLHEVREVLEARVQHVRGVHPGPDHPDPDSAHPFPSFGVREPREIRCRIEFST